ncbi:hypothetical protein K504DRAFT_476151 [Pleomassaria siparia CBS 279.74]|uniref:Transcription factor domain-containing protein n=1 Tax=Pleomassaria siparia CBS 279.74 TaxID=1314801 RepID=A0A6G1KC85_9PLEO|nr:hypothetical protein K504DRAFT_476151 [Pleomassaria siparia CBS 279.74]
MARIATIYYQLHSKLRLRPWSPSEVAEFVFHADDQLAALIEQLPPHLQNDADVADLFQHQEKQRQWPWIATQRTSLVMVLLYYRLAINRILQAYWLEGSTNYARARSICLSSAIGVINSAVSGHSSFTRLRSWDFAMIIFSATVTLALEVRKGENPDPQFTDAIIQSDRLLERVQSQNKLAREALSILHELKIS